MFGSYSTGNGNGNKLNLRTEILEGLLASMGEGKNAKINSLKQTIMRNKTDMAGDAFRSLDLMRQVFQSEMTDEFRQIIERHLRTTFSPALENLQRNGLEVTDDDIKCLCRSILEAAKKPFLCEKQMESFSERGLESPTFPINTESDLDSETSVVNFVVHQRATAFPPRGRKRGRPPKVRLIIHKTPIDLENFTFYVLFFLQTDNLGRNTPSHFNMGETFADLDLTKWNPDRVCSSSQFVLVSKFSRLLMLHNYRDLFMKYPSLFRYSIDETDRKWLIENRLTTRLNGKIYLLLLNDADEIANAEGLSYVADVLKCFAFCVPPSVILKIKQEMRKVFDASKNS
uniref:DNTTIP1 dimerisation domain-containing protein n=1 Tax=Setaria digitata TaxID=48799 RepID=A0A915PW47_9BILA